MSASHDEKLSAYFEGLVDVCEGDEGQLLYMSLKDGIPFFEESACRDTDHYLPPDREHLPFTLPRAGKVLEHFGNDDLNLYHDVLAYLKRFSALDELEFLGSGFGFCIFPDSFKHTA